MSPRHLAVAFNVAVTLAAVAIARDAGAHGSSVRPIEDQPVTAPKDAEAPTPAPYDYDWTGLHVGGHMAYGIGLGHSTLAGSPSANTSSSFGSPFGGVQVGYDHQLRSRVVVGVEGDIAFPYFANDGIVGTPATAHGTLTEKLDFVSTLRARVGYGARHWLVYGTGGVAWSQARFLETSASSGTVSTLLRERAGWAAGFGTQLAIAPAWSVRMEYLFERLGLADGSFASGTTYRSTAVDLQTLRLGIDWHFDGPPSVASAGDFLSSWALDPASWNVHGQLTFIEQGYLRFRSPYEGPNSLSGGSQAADTVSATAFVGLRLWKGGELYVNPEVDQGFGLGNTLGVAGFPNGEAQKASYPVPRFNLDRVFLRETIGLGGEQADAADGANQLAGRRDVSRLTLTAGKLSVGDAFDYNSYAYDPRTQFLNWNIYGGGSFDWTMDKPGFTWGALADLNQRSWALRVGYYLVPVVSNANTLDTSAPTHGQYTAEAEWRYRLFAQPGTLRLFGWVTRANMGSYEAALAVPFATAGSPDIAQTREVRFNGGVVLNAEQAITSDLGAFARASWSPGQVEIIGWTDCDESVSAGAVLAGTAWTRAGDRLGLGGVVEGLSKQARAYFAAGGVGILIGDGRLAYRPEEVVEAYYALRLNEWATLTADYQLIVDPAYNADRGPVSVYAGRFHAEL